MNPPKDSVLQPNELLKLLKRLYDLSKSGNYWGHTLQKYMIDELETNHDIIDTDLSYKSSDEEFIGLCTIYVDDASYAKSGTFQKAIKDTKTKFSCRKGEYDSLQFSGFKIETTGETFFWSSKIFHQLTQVTSLKCAFHTLSVTTRDVILDYKLKARHFMCKGCDGSSIQRNIFLKRTGQVCQETIQSLNSTP